MKKVKNWIVLLLAVVLFVFTQVDRSTPAPGVSPDPVNQPGLSVVDPAGSETEEIEIYEDGVYDTKEEVAYYLHVFHKLPSNYMTKNKARNYGWEGGALNTVVDGMCIGGDRFGNYEGVLPEDVKYRECDINTLHSKSRGAERIIYSDEWDIYYTDDHYESFELLYSEDE